MPEPFEQTQERLVALRAKKLFFILGCQKSGTTWLQQALDAHPQICCREEAAFGSVLLPLISAALRQYNQQQVQRLTQIRQVTPDLLFSDDQAMFLFTTAATLLLANRLGGRDVPCIGEKTPENAMCIGLLSAAFPGCRFVHILRDGRDVAVSGWFHNLRKGGPKFQQRFPDLPAYIQYVTGSHWVPYIQHARAFAKQQPQRYFELRYEDLHADFAGSVAPLLRFLGVDDSTQTIAHCQNAASFEKLSQGRARGQEDLASFFRKGVVGDWKNHFDPRCTEVFARHGGAMASELGYKLG